MLYQLSYRVGAGRSRSGGLPPQTNNNMTADQISIGLSVIIRTPSFFHSGQAQRGVVVRLPVAEELVSRSSHRKALVQVNDEKRPRQIDPKYLDIN